MTFSLKTGGVTVFLIMMVSFAMPLHAQTSAKQEKRLKMLEMLDQQDEQSFAAAISKAMRCVDSSDFNCAQTHLDNAEKYTNTQGQKGRLRVARQSLDAAIEQRRKERKIARQIEEEKQEFERQERQRQAEWEQEQERLAWQEENYDPDSGNQGWKMALEITNAYADAMVEKNRQRAQQIRNEQARRAAREKLAARQHQESQQREVQHEKKQRELARRLEAQRQAFERQQEQRHRQAQRTLSQAANSSRRHQPVDVGATSMSKAGQNIVSSSPNKKPSARKKQKVYEPMPQIKIGESGWFAQRSLAVAYARLDAVNHLRDQCRDKDARSDPIRFQQIRQKNTPGRWTYANPDCQKNDNDNWKCRAEVRIHCYRMQ